MPTAERLVELFAAQYRWGLHPLKMFLALAVPAALVWTADWWIRTRARSLTQEEPRGRRLPRLRRR